MKNDSRPQIWKMVKEAVEALGGKTTNVAVRDWILKKYPGTNPRSVGCHIIVCTVNHASRVHYGENQKPRKASGQYDFLFRPAKGELVMYDPRKHGEWGIAELEDGKLVVRETGREDADIASKLPPEGTGATFAAEAHLREYLVKNLHKVEEGLELYTSDDGTQVGVEFQTEMGRIDILSVDKAGGFLVIELKVERGPDEVCGQIMRYVGWVKRNLAGGKPVRGLIIARHISDRIRYALADVPDVSSREYELNITLRPVPNIDSART